MDEETKHSGTQGGSHEQHVEAGKQSHKNAPDKDEALTSHSTSYRHPPSKEESSKGGQHSHEGK